MPYKTPWHYVYMKVARFKVMGFCTRLDRLLYIIFYIFFSKIFGIGLLPAILDSNVPRGLVPGRGSIAVGKSFQTVHREK